MRFDVSDLRIFKAVVDSVSMTKAATRVHLTVASVSERIRQMEDQVGVPLFSRTRSGVVPTEAGRVLLHHAVKVLKQVDFMNEDLVNFTSRLRTNVRLYTTTYAVSEILQNAAPAFFSDNPNSDLIIEEQHSEDIVFAVTSGAAEIGIIGDFVETGALEVIPLLQDTLVALCGPQFADTLGTRSTFADLLSFDFLGLGPGSRLQEQLEARARELGASMRYRARARNLDAICGLAFNNVGVAIVPRRVALRFSPEQCRIIELAEDWVGYDTAAVVQRRVDLPNTAASLLDCLIAAAH
ncbi:LysR family transcriptional regulator [Caballeronia sp. LZ033]|uniref:LysR family transcriptional regulator n=1 Tax=Caballeronia sp. LZ033 TaxID=3038566 RepID=UPI002864E986|nr:LysR family transcriptional regulator [Caballeronia sp. LZ033]MDR5815957.1 LysR family transcriptional regulator [Caballeronia sp. LZ033]